MTETAPKTDKAAAKNAGDKGLRKPPRWQQRLKRAVTSRAGRRMAGFLIITMLVVQLVIIGMGAGLAVMSQKKGAFDNTITTVKSVMSVTAAQPSNPILPISPSLQRVLLTQTPITGFAVYNGQFQVVQQGGEPLFTKLTAQSDREAIYTSPSGLNHEIVLDQQDLGGGSYLYLVRILDTAKTSLDYGFLGMTAGIALVATLVLAFVVLVLQQNWYLEPYSFLRRNLIKAARNPEQAVIDKSPFPSGDEIAETITLVQDLIKTNAKNLYQTKNAAQTQIHKLAYFDTLTSLPNRTLFLREMDRLTKLAEEKTGRKERFALVTADLDHFKDFNDSMGHAVGDAILKAVGKRLRSNLPNAAVVARSGEDEFAIAMPIAGNVTSSAALGEWVLRILRSAPYEVFNEAFQVRASVGVATYPDNSPEIEQVLRNADIALNRAKEEGRDGMREYLPEFDAAVQARFQMLRDLRLALQKSELTPYYQPQFDLSTGKIIGAEALLRWFKEDPSAPNGKKFISPADFIPVAEQSGIIVPIGEYVMRTAMQTLKGWHNAGHQIRMAVNVSGQQIFKSDVVGVTRAVINETGIDPKWLELEITESIFMEDTDLAISTLKKLHDLGVEIALDDFGTGYSSLSYLRKLPIDRVKIDQSFVRNSLTSEADAAITRAIIKMCHSLKLKTIAEGVETREHEYFLRQEVCDEVQGFRYSKALPAADFATFMSKYPGDMSHFDMNPGH